MRFGNVVENFFEIIGEEKLFDIVKIIVFVEVFFGFDIYFLVFVFERGYFLIICDKFMCVYVDSFGVYCFLIDEFMGEDDIRKFMGV